MKLVFLSALLLIAGSASSKKIVCYFEAWAVYRPGDGVFDVEDIDPTLCTHILYGFAGLDGDTFEIVSLDPDYDLPDGADAYRRFTGLVSQNSDLVPMLSVGGWDEGSTKFSDMASSYDNRQAFINSALQYCNDYGFKGIDVDWEYPTQRGGKSEDKENFVTLIQELRDAFASYGYQVSAAVGADSYTADSAYDIPGLSDALDFINIMLYDFHGYYDGVTGHNAPLNPRPEEDDQLGVEACVDYWINSGADPAKLIMGTGFYGQSYTLANSNNHGPDDDVTGPGNPGPYTEDDEGELGYLEICLNNWDSEVDSYWQAPYAYNGDQWVGYDDPDSLATKCQFAKSRGLGGAMTWAIDMDDFRGNCGQGRYPLLNALNDNC